MSSKTCIICIGANHHPAANISRAVATLNAMFPDIQWGETVITPAEGTSCTPPSPYYHNLAATFTTTMDIRCLRQHFKEIETSCGRTPLSKSSGLIPLDIDILVYDGEILKPRDMEYTYVRQALSSLNINI